MYSEIHKALLTHLELMSGVIEVAGDNLEFEPVEGVPYLETFILHANGEVATLGNTGYDRYPGVFQINLRYPKGSGSKDQNDMATLIKNRFRRGLSLVSGGVTVRTLANGLGPVIPDRQWDVRPFSVTFFTDIQNT